VNRFVDLGLGAERGDDGRYLVLHAKGQVVLQAIVGSPL
jgi:hypothetical protein